MDMARPRYSGQSSWHLDAYVAHLVDEGPLVRGPIHHHSGFWNFAHPSLRQLWDVCHGHFWRPGKQRKHDGRSCHHGNARENQPFARWQHNRTHIPDERCRQSSDCLADDQEQHCRQKIDPGGRNCNLNGNRGRHRRPYISILRIAGKKIRGALNRTAKRDSVPRIYAKTPPNVKLTVLARELPKKNVSLPTSG